MEKTKTKPYRTGKKIFMEAKTKTHSLKYLDKQIYIFKYTTGN